MAISAEQAAYRAGQMKALTHWITMSVLLGLIDAPDGAARLSAIDKAYARDLEIPDIRVDERRPNDYPWHSAVPKMPVWSS